MSSHASQSNHPPRSTPSSTKSSNAKTKSCSESVVRYLSTLFPSLSTRVLFFLWVLFALGIILYYLVFLIRDKWVYSVNHPSTEVKQVVVNSVPAFEGLLFRSEITDKFGADEFAYADQPSPPQAQDGVASLFLIPFMTNISSGAPRQVSKRVTCQVKKWILPHALCEQFDPNRNKTVIPFNEQTILQDDPNLTGDPAYTHVDWSDDQLLQYKDMGDALCWDVHVFYNVTRLGPLLYRLPVVSLFHYTAQKFLQVKESIALNQTSTDDPLTRSILNSSPRELDLISNSVHLVNLQMERYIDIHKKEKRSFQLIPQSSLELSDRVKLLAFQDLIRSRSPYEREVLYRRVNASLDPNNNGTFIYAPTRLCLGMTSFAILTVTETISYSWLSFFSDIGGFLNLLALLFFILFPISRKMYSHSRTFLVVWLYYKLSGQSHKLKYDLTKKIDDEDVSQLENGNPSAQTNDSGVIEFQNMHQQQQQWEQQQQRHPLPSAHDSDIPRTHSKYAHHHDPMLTVPFSPQEEEHVETRRPALTHTTSTSAVIPSPSTSSSTSQGTGTDQTTSTALSL